MLFRPSDHARDLLAQSLPVMKSNQDALVAGIAAYLRATDPESRSEDSEPVAANLVALLLGQAGRLMESGQVVRPDDIKREHDALGIMGRHYSCFGDALVPVIRDVIGRGTPREVSSAWVDSFWAMIRAIHSDRTKAAA